MADEDDNKTEPEKIVDKPEDVKPVDDAPPPVNADNEAPKDDVRDLIKNLTEKVDGLETMINTIVETGGERDSVPGGRTPWTHRRFL
jgi:hypothetical protein